MKWILNVSVFMSDNWTCVTLNMFLYQRQDNEALKCEIYLEYLNSRYVYTMVLPIFKTMNILHGYIIQTHWRQIGLCSLSKKIVQIILISCIDSSSGMQPIVLQSVYNPCCECVVVQIPETEKVGNGLDLLTLSQLQNWHSIFRQLQEYSTYRLR